MYISLESVMSHSIISNEINAGIPAYVQPVYTLKD